MSKVKPMNVFVINLDKAEDRWARYEGKGYTRWRATQIDDLPDNDWRYEKMSSYWNLNPLEHKAKTCCFISHLSLLEHIVKNKLENVLILEDDAVLVNELPDISELPTDGFTYLGGFTSHKRLTDGPLKVDYSDEIEIKNGVNKIEHSKYRMLMMLAIFIPHWSIAYKMGNAVSLDKRWKAIDTLLYKTPKNQYMYYPACFSELPIESQIRPNKKKFSNTFYHVVSGKVAATALEELHLDVA